MACEYTISRGGDGGDLFPNTYILSRSSMCMIRETRRRDVKLSRAESNMLDLCWENRYDLFDYHAKHMKILVKEYLLSRGIEWDAVYRNGDYYYTKTETFLRDATDAEADAIHYLKTMKYDDNYDIFHHQRCVDILYDKDIIDDNIGD